MVVFFGGGGGKETCVPGIGSPAFPDLRVATTSGGCYPAEKRAEPVDTIHLARLFRLLTRWSRHDDDNTPGIDSQRRGESEDECREASLIYSFTKSLFHDGKKLNLRTRVFDENSPDPNVGRPRKPTCVHYSTDPQSDVARAN